MIPFKLTLLGTNAAMPAYGRFTTQQILNINHHLIMIDCGEGVQIRLNQYKIKKSKIELILISHLHGDHVLGLPGLITSYNHLNRKEELHLIGPIGIKKFVHTILELAECDLNFPLIITELETGLNEKVFIRNDYLVTCFPLKHRIPCFGYKIEESGIKINVDKEAIKKYQLRVEEILQLKEGKDLSLISGQLLKNDEATLPRRKARSYAYCSDTVYDPTICEYIKGVSLLYHETTYLNDLEDIALERMHTTGAQAAKIAKQAAVEKLVTGHYSSRYRSVEAFKLEVEHIFPNVILGYDGTIIYVD